MQTLMTYIASTLSDPTATGGYKKGSFKRHISLSSCPPTSTSHSPRHHITAMLFTLASSLLFAGLTTQALAQNTTVVQIHPNGNSAKCLDLAGNNQANNTPVDIYDCNGTGAQNWVIQRANTAVQLNGTNFCLDAGSSKCRIMPRICHFVSRLSTPAPGNAVHMKIYECFDNLPAQEWYYTTDNRIALFGQGKLIRILVYHNLPWRC